MTVLQLKEIEKAFITGNIKTQAVNRVDMAVQSGEFVAIMGPSGSGKSTLLNIMGLLERPDSGQVLYQGQDLGRAGENQRTAFRRDNIGFIFQGFNLIDELTVLENVALPLKYRGVAADKRRQLAAQALESVGVAHRANHVPSKLSGGQQQRVAIARAIAGEPQIILADEPTGNLDSKTGEDIMRLLKGLNDNGATIVMVTHSERDSGFANRLVRMQDGCVISDQMNPAANQSAHAVVSPSTPAAGPAGEPAP